MEKVDASTYRSFVHSLIHNALDIRLHARSLGYQDASEPMPILGNQKETSKRRFPRGGGAFGRRRRGCFSATQSISVRPKHRPQNGGAPISVRRMRIFQCFQAAAPVWPSPACRGTQNPVPLALPRRSAWAPARGSRARPLASRPLGPAPRPASALRDANVGVSARPATS